VAKIAPIPMAIAKTTATFRYGGQAGGVLVGIGGMGAGGCRVGAGGRLPQCRLAPRDDVPDISGSGLHDGAGRRIREIGS